jgi:hypothetical protein
MNIFKNILNVTMCLALLFLFSCEKDQISTENNSLTDEINAVVTKFDNGDVKIEFPWYPGFQKNEEVSSASLDRAIKVQQELDKSYSKQTTYLKSAGNTVGVIKQGSCGQYKELYIYMDCEDTGAASSKSGTYFGECSVNSAKNITLLFCVVTSAYFQATNVDYAVLDLSSYGWPTGVSKIKNQMINETHANINACTEGGTYNILTGINSGGTSKKNISYGETIVTSGTVLTYYYYPKVSTSTPFPTLGGIHYGVFGSFGASGDQGNILVDNEDGGSSWVEISLWTNAQFSGLGAPTYPVDRDDTGGVVKVDHNRNTTLYFSKVY